MLSAFRLYTYDTKLEKWDWEWYAKAWTADTRRNSTSVDCMSWCSVVRDACRRNNAVNNRFPFCIQKREKCVPSLVSAGGQRTVDNRSDDIYQSDSLFQTITLDNTVVCKDQRALTSVSTSTSFTAYMARAHGPSE